MSERYTDSTLPDWPKISCDEDKGEWRVRGRHVSYFSLRLGLIVHSTINLAVLALAIYFFFVKDGTWNNSKALSGAIFRTTVVLIFSAVLFGAILNAKNLARIFFRKKTEVTFTREGVAVGGEYYELPNGPEVSFRSDRPFLSSEKFTKVSDSLKTNKPVSYASYRLEFRKVEMIYGSKLVEITSVDSREKAEQFVIVLQAASELAWKTGEKKSAKPQELDLEEIFDNSLPE